MSDVAIRVEHLSKQYQLGGRETAFSYQTFREALIRAAAAPLQWFKGERRKPDKFWALDDISLEIKQGEAVGIIGRNGAGKSTLLKILSSITAPTRGRVELYGRVGSLLEVGTGFHPELTGRENIFLNGAILGMSHREIQRKFDEIVAFAEVEKFLDTPVKYYSSGMYVRLAFGVAAHLEPDILVVDEVLAVGDAEFQKKCLGKMSDVAQGGRTVLFVSHNMGAITRLCAQTILLRAGKVVAFGETGAIVHQYLTQGKDNNADFVLDPARKPESNMVFTRVSVLGRDGMPQGEISVLDGFRISLEVFVRGAEEGVEIDFIVTNQSGVVVFASELSANKSISPNFSPGTFNFTVEIPPNFLTPGTYTISPGIHRPNLKLFDFCPDIVSFTILETGSALWMYSGANIGVILVDFPWQMEKSL